MLTAITRAVSPAIVRCQLSFLERQPIDLRKAREQHRAYEELLKEHGAQVISLPAEVDLPDSVFVEDTAIVLDELAVILPLGTETRRLEAASMAEALAPLRKLEYVTLPGTLEGGDVLRIHRKLFAGISGRSNVEGIRQLAALVSPHGYEVTPVRVASCLHLKSAVTYLGGGTLLANGDWFDTAPFAGFDVIGVATEESHAANALALDDTIILPAAFRRTRVRVQSRGFRTRSLDISELQKAEAGLTCASLLFDS